MTVWAIVVAIATDRSLWARSWALAEPASPSANSAATGYANLFIRTPPELKPPCGRAAWQSYYLSFSDLYRAKRGPPPPQVSAALWHRAGPAGQASRDVDRTFTRRGCESIPRRHARS